MCRRRGLAVGAQPRLLVVDHSVGSADYLQSVLCGDADVQELIRTLLGSQAQGLLCDYFDPDGSFAGATYDLFEPSRSDTVSSADLLAVSMLDVPIKPLALRRILGAESDEFAALLASLPVGLDLWDATAADLSAIDVADDTLRGLPGFGPVVASKLLARKRPRLVPVVDRVILVQLGQPAHSYKATRAGLARWLRDPDLQARLSALAEPLPRGISALRVLDVVLWMRGSGSRNARRSRTRHGLA